MSNVHLVRDASYFLVMRLLRCKPSIRGSRASACFFEAASGGTSLSHPRKMARTLAAPETCPLGKAVFSGRYNSLRHRNFPPDGGCSQGRMQDRPALCFTRFAGTGARRIRNRVALGGRDGPETDARRRFLRSHSNLQTAAQLADKVFLCDNSLPEWPHRVVAIFNEKTLSVSDDVPDWAAPVADAMMLRAG